MKKLPILSCLLFLVLVAWNCTKEDFQTPAVMAEEKAWSAADERYPFPPPAPVQAILRTQTQADWGAEPRGDNAAAYLYERFDLLYGPQGRLDPLGLTIGAGDRMLVFRSAREITAFLPQGLEDGRDRPGPDVLGGELVALTLNVHFDDVFKDFGWSDYRLRDMIVRDEKSAYYRWTVGQILKVGNEMYAGDLPSLDRGDLHIALRRINENYRSGAVDLGFLKTPPEPAYRAYEEPGEIE